MALPVSLLAARNIVPSNWFRFPVRRFLDSVRGVDTLIWALVWINVVGLGPFAGVLAIAVADFGAFGKLFSEAFELADKKQVEGVRASGGNSLHEIRFGLLPQVLPVIAGPGALLHRVRTPAPPPSSASSAQAVSACSSPNRSACSNGKKCRS